MSLGVVVLVIGVIDFRGNCPTGVMVLGVSCPGGYLVERGSSPQG